MTSRRLSPSRRTRTRAAVLALTVVATAACGVTVDRPSGSAPTGSPSTSGPRSSSPSPSSSSGGSGGSGALAWQRCPDQSRYECATLRVPLDYAAPDKTISLALIRAKATSPNRIGSLLINPGGPGASTVDSFDGLAGTVSADVRERFDVVGFDPRGVGQSSPVECLTGKDLEAYLSADATVTNEQQADAGVDSIRAYVAACEKNSGDILPFIDTVNTAIDIDEIRKAVGDEKTTYLGFSYGTRLGARYATLFPDKVRAVVLDGAVDDSTDALQGSLIQAEGFQRSLSQFAKDCESRPSCSFQPENPDLVQAIRELREKVAVSPLPASSGRTLQVGEFDTGVLVTLYQEQTWPILATALAAAEKGDGGPLLRLADIYNDRKPDGTYANTFAANAAINCRDQAYPFTLEQVKAAAIAANDGAPDFGPSNVLSNAVCVLWPAKPDPAPPLPSYTGQPPVVVVGTTGDPATPYVEAQGLHRQLSSSVLITREGEDHTAYGYSACVRSKVDAYLIEEKVPETDARCSS